MTAKKNKEAAAVLELAEHFGITLAAGGGRTFEVELSELGLEVEITMAVRRTVSHDQEIEHRDGALELLGGRDGAYRDRCACSAKNRAPFRLSKTKECSKPVTSVVVYSHEPIAYSFRCTHHREDQSGHGARAGVLAVVTLPAHALKALRAQRKRDQDERERFEKMTEAEKVANDAQLVGRKDEAAEILQEETGRPSLRLLEMHVRAARYALEESTPEPLPMVQVSMNRRSR
jgi:hypothetical protein